MIPLLYFVQRKQQDRACAHFYYQYRWKLNNKNIHFRDSAISLLKVKAYLTQSLSFVMSRDSIAKLHK